MELEKKKNKMLDELEESLLDALVLGFFQHSENNIYCELFMEVMTFLLKEGGEGLWMKVLFKVNLLNKLHLAYSSLVQNKVLTPHPPPLLCSVTLRL